MKSVTYFSHDTNARNDERILMIMSQHGHMGYAIFFMLIEMMAETGNGYLLRDRVAAYAFAIHVEKSFLLSFIGDCLNNGLFVEDDKGITSPRLQKHISIREERKIAGAAGGRRNKKQATPDANNPLPFAKQQRTVIDLKGGPLNFMTSHMGENIKALKDTMSPQFNKVGQDIDMAINKWCDTIVSTNMAISDEDSKANQQLFASLRKYLMSWITNNENKAIKQQPTTQRDLRG